MARNRQIQGNYRKCYHRMKLNSPILNGNFGAINAGCSRALKDLLNEFERRGNPNDPSSKCGRVQVAESKVSEIEDEFARKQQQAVNQGYDVPKEMAGQLLDRYHEALASLDIVLEEQDCVEARLKKVKAKEKENDQDDHEKNVLKHGPCGAGWGDPLRQIDGQKVAMDRDGELSITDKFSPYNGMKVREYRKYLVKPFIANRVNRNLRLPRKKLPAWPEEVPKPNAKKSK